MRKEREDNASFPRSTRESRELTQWTPAKAGGTLPSALSLLTRHEVLPSRSALLAFALLLSLSCAAPAPPFAALSGPPWELAFDKEGLLVLGEPVLSPEGELFADQSPLWRFDLDLEPLPLGPGDALRRGATCLSDEVNAVARHLSSDGSALRLLRLSGDTARETTRLAVEEGRIDCPTVLPDGALVYAAALPSGTELRIKRPGQKDPEVLLRSEYQWSTGWRHAGASLPSREPGSGRFVGVAWGPEGERMLLKQPPEGGALFTYRLGFDAAACASAPVCGEEAVVGLPGGAVALATVSPEGEAPSVVFLSPEGEARWVRLSEVRQKNPLGMVRLPNEEKVAVAWLEEGMPGRLKVALLSAKGEILARTEATAFSPTPLAPVVRATEEEIQVAFSSARGLGSYQLQLLRLDHTLARKDESGLFTTALALLPLWGWLFALCALLSLVLGWLWGQRLRFLSSLFKRARPEPPGPELSGMVAVRGLCLPEGETLPLEQSGDHLRPGAPFSLEGPKGKLAIDPKEALLFSLPGGAARSGAISRGTEMVALGHVSSPRSVAGLDASEPSAALSLLDDTPASPRQDALRADPDAHHPARSEGRRHTPGHVSSENSTLSGPCFLIEGELGPVAAALQKSARDRLWAGVLAGAFFFSVVIIRGLLSIAGG